MNQVFKLSTLLLLASCMLFSQALAIPEFIGSEEESLTLSQSFSDDLYAAGQSISLSSDVNGDAVLAAGDISLSNSVAGDVMIAGANISINGNIADDLKAAGAQITMSGDIGDDAFLAGAKISISDSTIGGSAMINAVSVSISNTTIAEGGKISGDDIFFDGQVAGDMYFYGENIDLGENTQIGGDLYYDGKLDTESAAEYVQGNIIEETRIQGMVNNKKDSLKNAGLAAYFWSVSSLALFSLLLLIAIPKFFTATAKNIIAKPWVSLGMGALWFIAMPILAILISITILGLPIGLFALGIWGLAFLIFPYICTAVLAAWIIQWKGLSGFLLTLAAVIITAMIIALPFTMVIIAPFVVGGIIREKMNILAQYKK